MVFLAQPKQLIPPLAIGVCALLAAGSAGLITARQLELHNRVQAARWLSPAATVLAADLERAFRLSSALASAVVLEPRLHRNPALLQQVARPLLDGQPVALALQLAPGGVIRVQVPPSATAPIGLDLLRTPINRPSALRALRSRHSVLQGPFPLVQGGRGVVIRTPVFLGEPGSFWGFSSALLDWDRLLASSRSALPQASGLRLVVRRGSASAPVLAGRPAPVGVEPLATTLLQLPTDRWQLEAVRDSLLTGPQQGLVALAAFGGGAAGGGGVAFVLWQMEHRRRAQRQANQLPFATATALSELARRRDEETGLHLERCSLYARALAQELRRSHHPEAASLSDEAIDALAAAVPLHDIGKVAIPDAILRKPGRLTPEERQVMNGHTTLGAEIITRLAVSLQLHDARVLQLAQEVALCHHENWDGSGYPHGLSGQQIPLSARIMAVIDVYDAMASRRVYKPAIAHAEVLSEMARDRGRKFDPELLDLFLQHGGRFRQIFEAHQDPATEAGPELAATQARR